MSDLCDYGCTNIVTHIFKNGTKCCSTNPSKCDAVKRRLVKIQQTNSTPCNTKGFKQPKTKCSICEKEVSNGNFKKHYNACLGKGKQQNKTCFVCDIVFKTYNSNQKTCSIDCRNQHLKTVVAEQYSSGERFPVGYTKKSCYYESETHGKIKLMSSYEYDVCVILDEWLKKGKIDWWDYTDDRFTYLDKYKKPRTYFPDFKVFGNSIYYIESKGFETENDSYKWDAVRKHGFELQVWFKDDIDGYRDNKD